MPVGILSPCLSTASVSLSLALSRNPMACLLSGGPALWSPSALADMVAIPIVAVVGATASGKTALSLDLAERLGGEIVNTDAMQVYRGMDIGTAKLPPAERRGIPHHLLDTLDVREPATVAQFQALGARRSSPSCARRARRRCWWAAPRSTPGRSSTASSSPAPTRRCARGWEAELERVGPHALHAGLAELDPEAAARMLPENGRRIVRALEVIELTGRPYSASLPVLEYADPHTVQIGVDIDRPTLDARIEQRVDGDVRGRLRRRGRAGCSTRASPRAAPPRARSATARWWRTCARRAHRDRGPRADRLRDPPLRAAPGRLVPQGPADRLAAPRRPRPGRQGARRGEQDRSGVGAGRGAD